jgi:hypothetical protein
VGKSYVLFDSFNSFFVMEGETLGDNHEQAVAIVRPYADAGATW